MKRSSILGLGAIALIVAVPFVGKTPVLAGLQEAGEVIVQNIMRPKVQLKLVAKKKIVEVDTEGKENITWQALENKAIVKPGDTLRYTVKGENAGEVEADNLMVTQPIPRATMYILDSASNSNGATITYSIDNGETFIEQPTIEVTLEDGTVETRPAPASVYTHVRFEFPEALDPKAVLEASYDVTVR
ncbi:MAG: DUF11 domain-containing protein [Moorea sp. SIOASIH]|uniref:hypothetical protein n=1 Tax=Moorena sp. SIOASIH TaxID=2607817 RepID=UPI0013BAD96E|nr:hypothetical protein [Moorena sp. SIOASIH]NEO38341.1 DUF11 domain-containing protein [Moorena sp. SIOASIH]NEO90010.1 DUF11 domain-containing protein [Moorena sp. SIO3G5]